MAIRTTSPQHPLKLLERPVEVHSVIAEPGLFKLQSQKKVGLFYFYPPEARAEDIEDPVILSALFEASGKLQALNIEDPGHEMAQPLSKATERDGIAIDSAAVMHIVFQQAVRLRRQIRTTEKEQEPRENL